MLREIDHTQMGSGDLGWLKSLFHFSFSNYYNPKNVKFGKLRVINDDLVKPDTGFPTHPHRDMEIVTYVIDGQLTHADSMGNERTLSRGDVQFMTAGTGITHSEYNLGDTMLRFLQIWIFPEKSMLTPNYGDHHFEPKDRHNRWQHIVSHADGNAPIRIRQDANIYIMELDAGKEADFPVKPGRQAYLVQIEGSARINDLDVNMRDAMEIVEEDIHITAKEDAHFLIIELAVPEPVRIVR